MLSVHFVDTVGTKPIATSKSSKETQTIPVNYASAGTDPPNMPERGVQTERLLLWNSGAAKTLRIESAVVDRILAELDRIDAEAALFAKYEQRRREARGIRQQAAAALSIRLIKSQQLQQTTSKLNFTTASSSTSVPLNTTAVTAIRCGPGSRVAILLGEAQHDAWCTEHQNAAIVLVHRRQTHLVLLPACPSDLLFGRYGELLIVGLNSGEIQLISGANETAGNLLWNSGSGTASNTNHNNDFHHNQAITKLQWLMGLGAGGGGADSRREFLLSIGLDGKVLKWRLEADNQLQSLQHLQIGLDDLPRTLLRKGNNGANAMASSSSRAVGLVDLAITANQQIFVATETGILFELDSEDQLSLKESLVVAETDGLEQIAAFTENQPAAESNKSGGNANATSFVWRTSNGHLHKGKLQQQGTTVAEEQELPVGRSERHEFCLLASMANATPLLFLLSEAAASSSSSSSSSAAVGNKELLAYDLATGELVLRDAQIGNQLEAIAVDERAGDLLIGITHGGTTGNQQQQQKGRQLLFFELTME